MDDGIVGSMIFITHELPLFRHVASSIAVMYAGEFVEYGDTEKVIFDPRHPYTKALMGAMLERGTRPARQKANRDRRRPRTWPMPSPDAGSRSGAPQPAPTARPRRNSCASSRVGT